jgi:hypothetical protein
MCLCYSRNENQLTDFFLLCQLANTETHAHWPVQTSKLRKRTKKVTPDVSVPCSHCIAFTCCHAHFVNFLQSTPSKILFLFTCCVVCHRIFVFILITETLLLLVHTTTTIQLFCMLVLCFLRSTFASEKEKVYVWMCQWLLIKGVFFLTLFIKWFFLIIGMPKHIQLWILQSPWWCNEVWYSYRCVVCPRMKINMAKLHCHCQYM